MADEQTHDVTNILQEWRGGDESAAERLFPIVYQELKRRARQYLNRERGNHTLQPTALVHEAYLRMVSQTSLTAENRAHFYAIVARTMRQILVDYARSHASEKRGGAAIRLSLDDLQIPIEQRAADLLALDEALKGLAQFDERKSKIVEMRFFGGLTDEEIAEVLQISIRTVLRDWKTARLWLLRELNNVPL